MASLGKRIRKGRTYYFIRTRDGRELAAARTLSDSKEMVAEYDLLERRAKRGLATPMQSAWTLADLKGYDLLLAREEKREMPSLERRWRMILEGLGPARFIEDVTPARIEAWTRERLKKAGIATVRRDRSVLRAALARARDPASGSGYSKNPFDGLPSRAGQERKARRKPDVYDPEMVEKILAAAWEMAANPPRHTLPGEWWQNAAMLELIYETASRESQIRTLRRSQVQKHPKFGALLHFPGHKRGEERLFPLEGRTWEILKTIPETSVWFFPSLRGRGPRDNFRRFLAGVAKRVGIPHLNLHSLRHSRSSALFRAGWSPERIQRLLGHRTVAMAIQQYMQLFPGVIRLPRKKRGSPSLPQWPKRKVRSWGR